MLQICISVCPRQRIRVHRILIIALPPTDCMSGLTSKARRHKGSLTLCFRVLEHLPMSKAHHWSRQNLLNSVSVPLFLFFVLWFFKSTFFITVLVHVQMFLSFCLSLGYQPKVHLIVFWHRSARHHLQKRLGDDSHKGWPDLGDIFFSTAWNQGQLCLLVLKCTFPIASVPCSSSTVANPPSFCLPCLVSHQPST